MTDMTSIKNEDRGSNKKLYLIMAWYIKKSKCIIRPLVNTEIDRTMLKQEAIAAQISEI
ncbi:MAG: hypothetical protein HKUEN01_12500 [Candidatus Kuenenia stuttgartiensis]|jgi:hypothetical protein|nr:MAG: hypothetical protein HKUEN01_12500 [Candidatus Kuenenia stuttgartiensis]